LDVLDHLSRTAGTNLDQDPHPQRKIYFNWWIDKIFEISQDKRYSSCLRFTLQSCDSANGSSDKNKTAPLPFKKFKREVAREVPKAESSLQALKNARQVVIMVEKEVDLVCLLLPPQPNIRRDDFTIGAQLATGDLSVVIKGVTARLASGN